MYANDDDGKAIGPFMDFVDGDYIDKASDVEDGYQGVKTGKSLIKSKDKVKNVKDIGKNTVTKYQHYKGTLFNFIKKSQKKVQGYINKVRVRVNMWRTTLPTLEHFVKTSRNFMGDSYAFVKTFEISDMWDIKREWSRELDARVLKGNRIGMSIKDYFQRRWEDVKDDNEKAFTDAFAPYDRYRYSENAPDGFHFDEFNIHENNKVPSYITEESWNIIANINQLASSQMQKSVESDLLTVSEANMRKVSLTMTSSSDYTDQLSVQQDILNKTYELSVINSQLADQIAYADNLLARLLLRDLERKEQYKKGMVDEVGMLTGYNSRESLDEYMENKFKDVD